MTDDPFALLGLPRRFEIDRAALQAAYLKRSALSHPDREIDPLRVAEAAALAARLNDARAILANDEQRAGILLHLLGGPAKEQVKSLPDGFLTEIMGVREEMEAAIASGDPARRAALEVWAADRRRGFVVNVGQLFDKVGHDSAPERLRDIRVQLNGWRYIERMIEQLDPDYRPAMG